MPPRIIAPTLRRRSSPRRLSSARWRLGLSRGRPVQLRGDHVPKCATPPGRGRRGGVFRQWQHRHLYRNASPRTRPSPSLGDVLDVLLANPWGWSTHG
jgi:hypothetical protein